MRVESAMYSSREGLIAHGQAISVIGDNIANASTTGFKQSRTEFLDLFSEGPSGRQSESITPVGNGVRVSAVRTIFTDGGAEATGRPLDLAIDGSGYFVVGDEANRTFTRNGTFARDLDGFLTTGDGRRIQGYQGNSTTLSDLDLNNFNKAGTPTSAVTISGNFDSTAALKTAAPVNPASFNDLRAQSSFLADAVSTYDSLGNRQDITIAVTKTDVNTWVAQAYIDGSQITGGTAGVPFKLGDDLKIGFGTNGAIPAAEQANAQITAANVAFSSGAAPGNFTINMGRFTQYAAASLTNSITQNGQGSGNAISYEVRKEGGVYAQLDNGTFTQVGTVALAKFPNQDSLIRSGSGEFVADSTAGAPDIGAPGGNGRGSLLAGSLERSNVDIADEFVDLVLYQRGYQANSQTLQATNQIIRDTISMMR